MYSNMRAYLDLGFEVEWVQVRTTSPHQDASPELRIDRCVKRDLAPPRRSMLGRVLYPAGLTTNAAWKFYFTTAEAFREEAETREKATPGAIHHFEMGQPGSAIPLLHGVKTVWSCPDIESDYLAAQIHLACEMENSGSLGHENRRLRFIKRAEKLMARKSSLILCIADHEAERMRAWGCPQAEFFP